MNDSLQRVLAYAQDLDPGFKGAIEGAFPQEISELESLLGRPLPESYRVFLERMGRQLDWLEPGGSGRFDLSVSTVLAYYRAENWLPSYAYIRIGSAIDGSRRHPHLALGSGEPTVIEFPGCTRDMFVKTVALHSETLAGSLTEWIAEPIFRMRELEAPSRRARAWLYGRYAPDLLLAVSAQLSAQGFELLWFSNSAGQYLVRPGAGARATAIPHLGVVIEISADEESVCRGLSLDIQNTHRLSAHPL